MENIVATIVPVVLWLQIKGTLGEWLAENMAEVTLNGLKHFTVRIGRTNTSKSMKIACKLARHQVPTCMALARKTDLKFWGSLKIPGRSCEEY